MYQKFPEDEAAKLGQEETPLHAPLPAVIRSNHSQTHNEPVDKSIKRFPCDFCDKSFGQNVGLNNHVTNCTSRYEEIFM